MNDLFGIFGPALIASFLSAVCYLVARRDFPPRDAVLVVIGVLIVGPVLAQVVGAWVGVSAGWLGLFFGFALIRTIDQVAGKRSYGKYLTGRFSTPRPSGHRDHRDGDQPLGDHVPAVPVGRAGRDLGHAGHDASGGVSTPPLRGWR